MNTTGAGNRSHNNNKAMNKNLKNEAAVERLASVSKKALLAIILLPTLLVLNESDHIWVNLVGLGYIGVLHMLSKTDFGKKVFGIIDEL